ncbi:MAG: hypothetical protein LAT57_00035 [Balneolales bacterium]|nr:hypothetical protein [Balneolales bacterium]
MIATTTDQYTPSEDYKDQSTYSSDDMIDAYLQGMDYAQKNYKELVTEVIKLRVDLVFAIKDTIISAVLNKLDTPIQAMFLKIGNGTHFELLICIENEVFWSEKYNTIVDIADELTNEFCGDEKTLSYNFLTDYTTLELERIYSEKFHRIFINESLKKSSA